MKGVQERKLLVKSANPLLWSVFQTCTILGVSLEISKQVWNFKLETHGNAVFSLSLFLLHSPFYLLSSSPHFFLPPSLFFFSLSLSLSLSVCLCIYYWSICISRHIVDVINGILYVFKIFEKHFLCFSAPTLSPSPCPAPSCYSTSSYYSSISSKNTSTIRRTRNTT